MTTRVFFYYINGIVFLPHENIPAALCEVLKIMIDIIKPETKNLGTD